MGHIRYCYEALAGFDQDGELLAPIRWYRAAPGAVLFPGRHSFGPSLYSQQYPYGPGPGEISPRRPPAFLPPDIAGRPSGVAPDGPLDWFSSGQPPGAPGLLRTASGIPLSCATGPLPGQGPCAEVLRSGRFETTFEGILAAVLHWTPNAWIGVPGVVGAFWIIQCDGLGTAYPQLVLAGGGGGEPFATYSLALAGPGPAYSGRLVQSTGAYPVPSTCTLLWSP